jgi:hypothetical protein
MGRKEEAPSVSGGALKPPNAQIGSAQNILLQPRNVNASSIREASFRHHNLHDLVQAGVSKRGWASLSSSDLPNLVKQRSSCRYLVAIGAMRESSVRLVATEGYPMHDPAKAVIVVDRVMLDAAIVPEASDPTSQRKRQVNSGRC